MIITMIIIIIIIICVSSRSSSTRIGAQVREVKQTLAMPLARTVFPGRPNP